MLDSVEQELKRSEDIYKSTEMTSLREQWTTDFGLWGPERFKMPEGEGEWDNHTSPLSKIRSRKVISLLASARMSLYIDVTDDEREKRKEIAKTEQLATGSIFMADRISSSVPSGKPVQSALAHFASLNGGTIKMVYYTEDEKGEVSVNMPVYDPALCQWIEGEGEIIWFCARRYLNKYYVEKKWGDKVKYTVDTTGNVLSYIIWDKDEWKIAIGKDWVEEEGHNLGYIPVNIRTVGATPYVNSPNNEYTDTMKYAWNSVFASSRDLFPLHSKLMSIEASKAIRSGKIKVYGEWDSEKSNNEQPQGLEKVGYSGGSDGNSRDSVVLFNTALGQKFGGIIEPPSNEIVERFSNRVTDLINDAMLDPITQGVMSAAGASGKLADTLKASSLEFVNPFKNCIEQDLVWIAEESSRQVMDREFVKIKVEGFNKQQHKFTEEISHGDVGEFKFDCELVFDNLRDESIELGIAIQKVNNRLSSVRTAMTDHNLHDDPDLEMEIMSEELHKNMADSDPIAHFKGLAEWYLKNKTKEHPEYEELALTYDTLAQLSLTSLIKKVAEFANPLAPGGGGGETPLDTPLSPQAEVGRIGAEARQI